MMSNFYFSYFPIVVCYVDVFLDIEGSICLDPYDRGKHLEPRFQFGIELMYPQWGVKLSTWTWDPILWMSSLDSFSISIVISHGTPTTFVSSLTLVHGN